jgi:hypothetical protein
MKSLLTLAVLALSLSTINAHAADHASCKAKLAPIADAYASYMAGQTDKCLAEMNKGAAERSTFAIIANCKNAVGTLQPLKNQSSAACSSCRGVDGDLANACKDDGAQNFIDRVRAL